MKDDPKQRRLCELFSELRRIKQKELDNWHPDEFVMAYRQARAKERIREVEREIDRVLGERDDE